jgi:DNA modification methylase
VLTSSTEKSRQIDRGMRMTPDTDIAIDRSKGNINRIIHGDALTELKKLPDAFTDLCITSPPYWNQRWYGDDPRVIGNESTVLDYINNLIEILGEVKRVLKKSGSCFVVISDKFNNKGADIGEEKRFVKYEDRSIPEGSLCSVPSRFAIAMTDRLGFVLKNDII